MDLPIVIEVTTQYLPEHKAAKDGQYVFAYQVNIQNHSQDKVTLMHRHWLVTDGNGKQNEVTGPGVIGKQPQIEPGDSFSYTSGVVIDTPVGAMQGHYEMQTSDGRQFNAPIDVFSLAIPQSIH